VTALASLWNVYITPSRKFWGIGRILQYMSVEELKRGTDGNSRDYLRGTPAAV